MCDSTKDETSRMARSERCRRILSSRLVRLRFNKLQPICRLLRLLHSRVLLLYGSYKLYTYVGIGEG